MTSRRLFIAALAIGIASYPGFAQTDAAGVPNFHQVNDHVYRGAQPTDQGFQSLAKLGVKTIIDLRHGKDHSDGEQEAAERGEDEDRHAAFAAQGGVSGADIVARSCHA